MDFIIKNIIDAPVTKWIGGNIIQLDIYPPEESYEDKKFLWYVSLASVELETSHFTVMPNYNRWIVMLDQSVTLSHDGSTIAELLPMVPYFFDGKSCTISTGRSRDFNLIFRKDISEGSLSSYRLEPKEYQAIEENSTFYFQHVIYLIYCVQGQCLLVNRDLGERVLCANQYAVFDHEFVVKNPSTSQTELIICRMYY